MVEEEARHESWFSDQCRGHWMLPTVSKVGRWSPADLTPEAAAASAAPAETSTD